MADLESEENSPSLFSGKQWTEWAHKIEGEDELNRSKHGSGHADSMRLKRDDMPLFGLCPAQDEFYLVVCETCKQVVKPQALQRHMEVRHGKKSRHHSPRRRKTSSTSSTTLSPTMRSPSRMTPPTRDERRANFGTRSSKHDVHGKTPPDEGGGGSGGTMLGLEFVKSPSSKHHHALSNTALASLHKQTDKQLQNHSMPVVKMERLPRTMSTKNNAPTLHVPPYSSSNHKSAPNSSSAHDSKSSKSSSKEQRDKSKGLSSSSSSHLSHELSSHSSKDENLETNDRTEVGDTSPRSSRDKKLDKADLASKHSDEEDGISLAKLKSESCLRSSKAELDNERISKETNDVAGRHDILNSSTALNDVTPAKKSHSSHHSSGEVNKSSKHKHSHSHNHSDRERSSKHREHSESSVSKHRPDKFNKLTWSNSQSKSPDSGNNNGNKHHHNSSKPPSKAVDTFEVLSSKEKHEVTTSKDKHSVASKGNDSGKENIVANVSKETSGGVMSDKRWNDITKLGGGTKVCDNKLDSRKWLKLEERPEKKTDNGLPEDDGKQNGATFITSMSSSSANLIGNDSRSKLTENSSAKSGLSGSDDKVEHIEKRHKPPSLNLSLVTPSSLTSPTLTSPTTPVLTSPETPATSSTKHLDKIDIHSPTSTFGKKLAAFQNPGKLLPCKDREYNPDIHCGVISKEDNKPCTRSLTCKSHALSLRRAVGGRVKPFDELLLEHRAAKEAFLLSKHGDGHQPASKVAKPPSATKSSSATSLSKTKSPSSSLVTKSHSMHLLTSRMASPAGAPSVKTHRLPSSAGHHTPHRMLPLATQLPPKPAQIADLPMCGPIPVPEMFTLPGMSDTDEDEDFGDRYEYPMLYHHPRPAMVNNFGCRNTGSGCYVFNRRTDQLRAVFKLAVDRRLHPPPNKRLCVDSKLGVNSSLSTGISSSAKDPYEFGTGSPSLAAAKSAKSKSHHKLPGSTTKSPANKSQHKAKEDQGSLGGINYSVLFEGGSYVEPPSSGATVTSQQPDVFTTGQPTITTAAGLISQRSSSDMVNSVGPAAKRKRSTGSSPRPTLSSANNTTPASIGGFALNSANNAISIAIPTGSLNLNLSSTTLNTLNATIAGNKLSQLAAGKKDVNLVVTGGTTTVLNGQLLTSLPTSHRNTEGGGTQVHTKNSLSSPPPVAPQKSKSRKRSSSRSVSGHDMGQGVTSVNSVCMDTVSMVTTSGFGVTSPSSAMTPSAIFPTGTTTSIPNGIIGQQGVKGVTSLNHVGCDVAMLTQASSGTSETLNALERHQPTPSKHKKLSHKHQKALQQQQLQQHSHRVASSPSSFSTSQRLITSSVPYSIHGNSAVSGASGYSHIQIQSKDPSGKTLTGKLAMQPVSLTIPLMTPGGPLPDGLAVMQGQGSGAAGQRALLIPTPPDPHPADRGPPHHHPSHHSHHEAIPQLTLQNSPSSLIS